MLAQSGPHLPIRALEWPPLKPDAVAVVSVHRASSSGGSWFSDKKLMVHWCVLPTSESS